MNVIARVEPGDGQTRLVRAEPFPAEFRKAITRVARDFGMPSDWLNAVIDKQWDTGLPPGLDEDITWQTYAALKVGFIGRRGLIPLKFFAAVDQGPRSKHWQDLLALKPTDKEVDEAVEWVRDQDVDAEFKTFVDQASEQLRRELEKR